jgi:hypothetical protein
MKEETSVSDILRNVGLSDNSTAYLGRPVGYGDINATILYKISLQIKEFLGQGNHLLFNQMVNDLPTLKPSFFIDFILRLQRCGDEQGWWWDKERMLSHYNCLDMPVCETTERIKREFNAMIH